jgi:hypothetical protein
MSHPLYQQQSPTMQSQTRPRAVSTTILWHVPAALVLAIYLPAALLGMYFFRDAYAASFLALLAIFAGSYYGLYPRFARMLQSSRIRSRLWRIGERITWRGWAWLAAAVYAATIGVAALTVPATPIGAALAGGNWLDIALARADFLATRDGPEALLRYLALILGRSVMPFLIAYLYWSRHRLRHLALFVLILLFLIPLEKGSPLFAFLPLVLLRVLERDYKAALAHTACLAACVGLATFLAAGGLYDSQRRAASGFGGQTVQEQVIPNAKVDRDVKLSDHTGRQYLHRRYDPADEFARTGGLGYQIYLLANRAAWVPYATAYDWLKFQHDVLQGQLVLGRSIGIVSWLMGEPRVMIEQMVYQFSFGASPGGAGASNTIFFVDAKLNFGWLGAAAYCALFTLLAAIVFTSANHVGQIASVTSFFTAALSPLSATLLSGGLLFYLTISMLTRLDGRAPPSVPVSIGP